MRGKRLAVAIRAAELRLVRRLARQWRVSETDVVRLAVWAYVLPLAPALKAPVELPARRRL